VNRRGRGATAARQRGFLDFSITEIVITFGVALVVLGPKKLPGLVGQVGRWMGRARVMARQFREQLEQEVNSVSDAMNVTTPVSRPAPLPPDPPVTTAAAPSAQAGAGDAGANATADATTPAAAPVAQSFHGDSPTHFTMNGTTPGVSFSNPLDDAADAAEPLTPPSAEAEAAVPGPAPAQDVPAARS